MRDSAGVLGTDVDHAVDHGSPLEYAKTLRDIVFSTLTCYVGRCRVTHLHARSLGRGPVSFRGKGGAGEAPT